MTRSEALDYTAWLEVPPSAPPTALVSALEERQSRYQTLLTRVSNDAELKTDLELLLGRASMALRLARRAAEPPTPAAEAPQPSSPPPAEAPPPAAAASPNTGHDQNL